MLNLLQKSVRITIWLSALVLSMTAIAGSSDSAATPCRTCRCSKKRQKVSRAREANTEKAPSAWHGSNASLGVIVNTGNTETSSINAGVNVKFKFRRWQNAFQATGQFGSDSGVTTKEQYFAQNQLNYNFSHSFKQFVYANGSITVDYFSPYNYQAVTSLGYGRDIIKSPCFQLSIQAGPGWQNYRDRDDDEVHNAFVFATQTNVVWEVTRNGKLTEELTYNVSRAFNYLKSVTAFTNKITRNIALQISFTVSHYSEIPPDSTQTKKTDTTTSIAVVYNF